MQDQPSNSVPQTTPELPDHFDQEARLQFLYSFLNPDIDQFRVAELAGLKLSEYFVYINSEEFQQRLAQQTNIAEQRARACATLAQPKAVATLTHIIDSYNEAERDILLGRQPIALNIRQRHRESARRASWLILKLTGAIPTHLRAARPKHDRDESTESPCAMGSPLSSTATHPDAQSTSRTPSPACAMGSPLSSAATHANAQPTSDQPTQSSPPPATSSPEKLDPPRARHNAPEPDLLHPFDPIGAVQILSTPTAPPFPPAAAGVPGHRITHNARPPSPADG